MSVKTLNYGSVNVEGGSYTTPQITVNDAGQITAIVSQDIEDDPADQAAYDALNETINEIGSELTTINAGLTQIGQNQPTSITANLADFIQLEGQYLKAKATYDLLNPTNIGSFIVYSLAQDDFLDDDLGNGYSKLNPSTIVLPQGYYNIDFSFLGISQSQANKETSYLFRVSDQDPNVFGPCQSFVYSFWKNDTNTTFVAFNGSMVFQITKSTASLDLLVLSTGGNGDPISYKPPNPMPIGTYTQFPTSGEYASLPPFEVPTSPNAIVITSLSNVIPP